MGAGACCLKLADCVPIVGCSWFFLCVPGGGVAATNRRLDRVSLELIFVPLAVLTPLPFSFIAATQISNSAELADEYERLRNEKEAAERNTEFTYRTKKNMTQERRLVQAQKREAEEFQALLDEHAGVKMDQALWELFFLSNQLETLTASLEEESGDLAALHQSIESTAELLKVGWCVCLFVVVIVVVVVFGLVFFLVFETRGWFVRCMKRAGIHGCMVGLRALRSSRVVP